MNNTTSYWQQTSVSPAFTSDLPSSVDVVVIGGGLLGASISYWLAKLGRQVTLLERTALADGATGRNGGFLVASTPMHYGDAISYLGHDTARAVWSMTLENRALLKQVLQEEQIVCDYRETGHLRLVLSEEELGEAERSVDALRADGFAAELLARAHIQRHVRTTLGPDIMAAVFLPESALVHPARLVHGLVLASMRYGAYTCAADVTGLSADTEGVRIETRQGKVHARSMVVAVNAWTGQLLPVLSSFITPVRGQILAYAPTDPLFLAGFGAAITPTGEYWQQAADGTIVLGGCRALAPGKDVGVLDSIPTPEVQAALEQVLPRLFPQCPTLPVTQRWTGLMGFTRDYLPIADAVPGVANAWFVGGFSGHGMPFGLRLGQLLAKAVIEGTQPAELRPFNLDRPTLAYFAH